MKKIPHKPLAKKIKLFHSHKKRKQIARAIKIPLYLLVMLSVGINFYILLYINTFTNNSKSLINTNTAFQRSLLQVIDDTKEIRDFLSLPKLLYEFNDPITDEFMLSDIEAELDTLDYNKDELLLQQANAITQKYGADILSKNFTKKIEEYEWQASAKLYDFTLKQKNTTLVIRYNGSIITTVTLLYNNEYTITGFQYDSPLIDSGTKQSFEQFDKVLLYLHNSLRENLHKADVLRREIFILLQSPQISLLHASYNASWKHSSFPHSDVWKIYNYLDQQIAYIKLNHLTVQVQMDNIKIHTLAKKPKTVAHTISTQLLATNYKSSEDNLVESNTKLLLEYINYPSFQTALRSLGLSIVSIPRVESDYYYFDIIHSMQNIKMGAFAIQRSNGAFWTIDKDDVPITQKNIFAIAPPEAQKSLGKRNILLVGSHNKLADTIMVANISPKNQIKLISIPRDLYYKGRKINWYFKRFSHTNFSKLVGEVVGLPITQYIFVDMYAFVSIIDILGGINVTLDEDLIDTTYTIKENGILSYLFYVKGEHYLSGIEALRIARSRYSTDDFNRSVRQQAILYGIQDKLNSVDQISSFITAFNIIDSIRPHITTNISTIQIVQMIQKYRNASISDKTVLSTRNILYSTYSNAYEKNLTVEELGEDKRGLWILLPKNNNWESLHLYVNQFIME